MNTRIICALWTAAAIAADAPLAIAHRGGAALRPENTLAAFRHAISLKVPVLEFDMNLTADDAIAIHHDSALNTSICKPGASGPIRGLKLAQLRQLDCGSFTRNDSPHFQSAPGERMPTLDEFFTLVKDSGALLLGETKMPADHTVPPERFVQLIDAVIRRHGLGKRFVLQSSDYRTTDAMRKINPEIRICLLNSRRYKPNYLEIVRRHGATHLMLRHDDVTPGQVRELKAAGVILYSGTANRPEDWAQYVSLGFDGILTDDPLRLLDFLYHRKQ